MSKQIKKIRPDRKKARVWMLENDIRSVDIQKALRMTNHSTVANTLAGRQNNRRVLLYLVDKGCPVESLDIPKRMREEIVP